MGLIRDTKVTTAQSAARKAKEAGRRVFLYRQNVAFSQSNFSGPLTDIGEVIEGIESVGWRLVDMAYDGAQSKNGGVILLFR